MRMIPTEVYLATDDGRALTQPMRLPATDEEKKTAQQLARVYGPIQKPKEKP